MFTAESPENKLDVSGYDPAEVIAAFYNAGRAFGNSRYSPGYDPDHVMTTEEARELYEAAPTQDKAFDFVRGRLLKIRFEGDELIAVNHDRAYSAGDAKGILATLVKK